MGCASRHPGPFERGRKKPSANYGDPLNVSQPRIGFLDRRVHYLCVHACNNRCILLSDPEDRAGAGRAKSQTSAFRDSNDDDLVCFDGYLRSSDSWHDASKMGQVIREPAGGVLRAKTVWQKLRPPARRLVNCRHPLMTSHSHRPQLARPT
jgi:hypothetical protein